MQTPPTDHELIELLHRHPQEGWSLFLETFAKLIYSYSLKSFQDVDMASDFNLFVYESLAANNFKKLKSFKFRCKLSSFLVTLMGNLKSDFTRTKFGRKTLPERIKRMPDFAQSLFKFRFWENMPFEEAALRMKSSYGAEATDEAIENAMDQIYDCLNLKMRGRLQKITERKALVAYQAPHPAPAAPDGEVSDPMLDLPDYSMTPEAMLRKAEVEENFTRLLGELTSLVNSLPFEERRLFMLRFDHGLSAKDIAKKLRIRPPERVYTILNQIKERLGEELRKRGYDEKILKDSFGG